MKWIFWHEYIKTADGWFYAQTPESNYRIWFTEITWNFDQCKTMGDFDITSSWIGSA